MLAPVDIIEIDTKLVRRPEMSFQSMPKLILADSKDDSKDRSSQQCHMILVEFSPLYLWCCCTYEALVSKSVVARHDCVLQSCLHHPSHAIDFVIYDALMSCLVVPIAILYIT